VIVYGLLPVLCYLLGAIPFGFLIVRARRGIDLRTVGSGNLGATNAARILGVRWFAAVFILDFLKGFISAFVVGRLAEAHLGAPQWVGLLYGLSAMVGHIWPIYLKFRGGKGVATAGGVVTGIAPAAAGITAIVLLIVLLGGRMVSLASMVAAVALPIVYTLLEGPDAKPTTQGALVLIAALVVVKHRSNLGRIVTGTESKIRLGKKSSEQEVEGA